MTTTPMTRRDVERIVQEARKRNIRPSLYDADMRDVDLSDLDLSKVFLYRANLRGAFFSGTNLSGASLPWADMSFADLRGANLDGADLHETNLSWALGVVPLGHTPSGPARIVPLSNGTWWLTVGCWSGTTDNLRTLIAGDDWPEAVGIERDLRRPVLESLADHADNLANYHSDWLDAVVKRWGASDE